MNEIDEMSDFLEFDNIVLWKTQLSKKEIKFINKIEKIWKKINLINKKNNFFKDIFLENLLFIDERTHEILSIKRITILIINFIISYQRMIEYKFPSNKYEEKIQEFANILVNMSFYYFILTTELFKLKENESSLFLRKKIDEISMQILNIPRVTSTQELYNEKKYWKITLLVSITSNQKDKKILHDINVFINNSWSIFLKQDRVFPK